MSKLKVAIICAFSDQKLRKNLVFPKYYWGNIIQRWFGKSNNVDFAVWDSHAIKEFEGLLDGLELHIITPHSGVAHLHEFQENGIFYHVFWSEWDIMYEKVKRKMSFQTQTAYSNNRKTIAKIIRRIKPDIVQVVGIENKHYSMSVLDMPNDIPVIAQLQTLISDDRFKEGHCCSEKEYIYDSTIEKKILLRSNYIGTSVKRFVELLKNDINPSGVYINTSLPLVEEIDFGTEEKIYDFVYFAADISKAADWAIESFAEASKVHPEISLDIIGSYTSEYKTVLDKRIKELGISDRITFEGKLPTHEDVLTQIRKARFALLPLKIDLVSSTIREAMASGLPVVTTRTPNTPNLNRKRECVLLSDAGNHRAMACNMIKLLQNVELAESLRENGATYTKERVSNQDIVGHWKYAYFSCVDNFIKNKPLPQDLLI